MAEDDSAPPTRLMNFVSQQQILKENKDKRDAEFNERFKHRPPKALDEDETDFLDKLQMSRKEYERQMADEEAQQLQCFQEAVAAQSTIVHELKETPSVPKVQEQKSVGKKNPSTRPLGMIIKVKPQAKKVKMDPANAEESLDMLKTRNTDTEGPQVLVKTPNVDIRKPLDTMKMPSGNDDEPSVPASTGLVSYSDESEDE